MLRVARKELAYTRVVTRLVEIPCGSSGTVPTFTQNEVEGDENKVLRHYPVCNETCNTDNAGHQPGIDLRTFIHRSETHYFQGSGVGATYSIGDQLVHQRVRVFVASLEPPEVPGNRRGGQNISQHPQTECDDGHRLQNAAIQIYSLGNRVKNHARRWSEVVLTLPALTQRW